MEKARRKLDPFLSKITKKVDIQSDNIALENYLTETKTEGILIEPANLHNSKKYSRNFQNFQMKIIAQMASMIAFKLCNILCDYRV